MWVALIQFLWVGVTRVQVLSSVVRMAPEIHWGEEKCCSSRSAQVRVLPQGTLPREWKVSY